MNQVIVRERLFNYITFHEYLFIPLDGKLCICRDIERFKDRIISQTLIAEMNTVIIKVRSTGFPCDEITSDKLKKSSGIWIVSNDCVPKGENKFENIPGKAQFYDLEIMEKDANFILKLCSRVWPGSQAYPLSLYHGTAKIKREGIVHNGGLQETFGMLGDAVYLGTFWKASRFAAFDKKYHAQEGEVFRTLVFVKEFQEFPLEHWACFCCGLDISDHKGIWKLLFDGAHVNIGNMKGQLRNEEWAVKQRVQFITHVAGIQPYEYTPYKRNIKIV